MRLLLDTNFIISFILPYDELHEKAKKLEMEQNITLENDCYISNQILTETINILGQKDSIEIAKATYDMLNDNFTIINEYEIQNFNDYVFNNYLTLNNDYKKHKLGFTDCSIITIAELYKMDAIVSFNKHFLKNKKVRIING